MQCLTPQQQQPCSLFTGRKVTIIMF